MSDISPLGRGSVGPLNHPNLYSVNKPNGATTANGNGVAHSATHDRDRVELSEHARFMDQLRELPSIRTERVEAVREAIINGTYETPEKLDIAVSRMLEEF